MTNALFTFLQANFAKTIERKIEIENSVSDGKGNTFFMSNKWKKKVFNLVTLSA